MTDRQRIIDAMEASKNKHMTIVSDELSPRLGMRIELDEDVRYYAPTLTNDMALSFSISTVPGGVYRLIGDEENGYKVASLVHPRLNDFLSELTSIAGGKGVTEDAAGFLNDLGTEPVTLSDAEGNSSPLYLDRLQAMYAIADAETPEDKAGILAGIYTANAIGEDGSVQPIEISPERIVTVFGGKVRRGRNRKSQAVKSISMPNDPASKAMFTSGRNAVTLANAMSGNPTVLTTSRKNKKSQLVIYAGLEKGVYDLESISEDNYSEMENAIMPNIMCRLVYGTIGSIANKSESTRIYGDDIAMSMGFSNGLRDQKSAATVVKILKSIMAMKSIHVALDTSKDYACSPLGGYPDYGTLAIERTLKPLLDCTITTQGIEGCGADGSQSLIRWHIDLNPLPGCDPITALPLYTYALQKKMLVGVGNLSFKGIRTNLDHKVMWSYVVGRVNERGTSNTISLDTMFREIESSLCDPLTRDKTYKMKNILERMLEERTARGVLTHRADMDKGTLTIAPVSGDGLIW